MDDQEYRIAIERIVADGKGFEAIRDISNLLDMRYKITEYERNTRGSEVRIAYKIAKSNQRAEDKIEAIKNLLDPDEREKCDKRAWRNIVYS